MTKPWSVIEGPSSQLAGKRPMGMLTSEDFGRPGDEVILGGLPPIADYRGHTQQPRPVPTVTKLPNVNLPTRNREWLFGHYRWRETSAPAFNVGDPAGDGRTFVLTDSGAWEYQGLEVLGWPQWFMYANKSLRANIGYYAWDKPWEALPYGVIGSTTAGMPDVALYQMERGKPIEHALHCAMPTNLLRLPKKDIVTSPPRVKLTAEEMADTYGVVWPASWGDIAPKGHHDYSTHRGRLTKSGEPSALGVPFGARVCLPSSEVVRIEQELGLDKIEGMTPVDELLDCMMRYGAYVTLSCQPTTRINGRMCIGITDDYLLPGERAALTKALQGATWHIRLDDDA